MPSTAGEETSYRASQPPCPAWQEKRQVTEPLSLHEQHMRRRAKLQSLIASVPSTAGEEPNSRASQPPCPSLQEKSQTTEPPSLRAPEEETSYRASQPPCPALQETRQVTEPPSLRAHHCKRRKIEQVSCVGIPPNY